MSWFTRNGIYEKVALYCIDKSPLMVDKDKLICKDGIITMKDVRLDHKIKLNNEENKKQDDDYIEVVGLIECITLEISSNGLIIEFTGSEVMINGTDKNVDVNRLKEDLVRSVNMMAENATGGASEDDNLNEKGQTKSWRSNTSFSSSTTDSNRQNLMNSMDSFGYTKSVMLNIASSFMGSIEEFKNSSAADEGGKRNKTVTFQTEEPSMSNDELLEDELLLVDEQNPSKSILDSFKNKIIDMALSNFQVKLKNTRFVLTNMELIIDIDSMEAKSTENERFLDFYSIKITTSERTVKYDDDSESESENLMSSSVYMSAISSFSKKFEQESEFKDNASKVLFSLEEISFYFISNNEPKKFIPKEVLVSSFTVVYEDMRFIVDSFNILISKNINKYSFKINEFVFGVYGESIDKKGFKIELTGIEYQNFVKKQQESYAIPTDDILTVQNFKVSHRHLNLTSKKLKNNKEAINVVFKNVPGEQSIDIKIKNLELVAKTYRIDSGLLLKIPRIFASYNNNKLKGAVKTFSVSLIENFRRLSKVDDMVLVDNISFQFFNKVLNIDVDSMNCNACCDSFHCFIQTLMDITYIKSFPDEQRCKRELSDESLNLKDILFGEDYFIPDLVAKEDDFIILSKSNTNNDQSSSRRIPKLKKNFLADLINQNLATSTENAEFLLKNDQPFDLCLQVHVSSLSLKMYDGYQFSYTTNIISESLLKCTDPNNENNMPNVLFDSIYLPTKTNNIESNDMSRSGYLDEFVFTNNQLPLLQKYKKHSGELVIENLELKFENMEPKTSKTNNDKDHILNKLCFSAKNIDILDNLEVSIFNKFLTSYKSPQLDHSCFKNNLNLLDFEIETVKPDPDLETSELRIFIKALPLKLHINEDFVDFLMRFFSFKDNRFELIDEYPEEIFIQKMEIMGLIISIDYKSKDNKQPEDQQKLKSVFLNKLRSLIVVENCDIKLKHLTMYAIDSGDDLGRVIKEKWLTDIVNSQRLALVSGVSPLKSAINISSAVKTLIEQPIQQSSKLGWSRSLQNGFLDFGKTTTNELLKLGLTFTAGTQNFLENTETNLVTGSGQKEDDIFQSNLKSRNDAISEDLIGSMSPASYDATRNKEHHILAEREKNKKMEINQPETFKKGLSLAYSTLEDNVSIALRTAMNTGQEVKQTENNSQAAKVFLNNIGISLIRPLIGASGALNKSFQGLQAQLQDSEINYYINERLKDKYKH